jgi:beta-lactamase regulating signal transducer with metallopeptidase domain
MSWLIDTLVWTGALIGVVLLTRRPVSRHFGPKAAYALWLVPLTRLALPPIVLPAWLAPVTAAPAAANHAVLVPTDAFAIAASAPVEPPFDWQPLIIAFWCAGAMIYIALRLVSYFQLRRELLARARPVGIAGRIRLLETPATASPLAFGVFDKVIALPPGFMASTDRRARDLALAHELAHHRAHDLALNFLALPMFALHWFNPLSLLGWRAMRRDQEAACDARVIEHRDRLDRAAYAMLIASAVAGPRGALAAPMACPVLGDKSIVHRLRNLTMTTPSLRRRRAGALLVGAGMLLVPLTASISYAQEESPEAPEPPLPPLPPAAPEAPSAPDAPVAPVAPGAPLPPEGAEGTHVTHHAAPDGTRRIVVVRTGKNAKDDGHAPRMIRERRVIRTGPDGTFDEKALEKEMEALEAQLEHLDKDTERMVVINRKEVARTARDAARAGALAAAQMPQVVMSCDGEGNVSESRSADGKRVIRICAKRIALNAASGLRSARARIAGNSGMSEATKTEVLRSLDREIERIEKDQ